MSPKPAVHAERGNQGRKEDKDESTRFRRTEEKKAKRLAEKKQGRPVAKRHLGIMDVVFLSEGEGIEAYGGSEVVEHHKPGEELRGSSGWFAISHPYAPERTWKPMAKSKRTAIADDSRKRLPGGRLLRPAALIDLLRSGERVERGAPDASAEGGGIRWVGGQA